MNLAKTLREPIADTVSRLGQETEYATANAEKFGETLAAARSGSYDNPTFQKEAETGFAAPMTAPRTAADLTSLLNESHFLGGWLLVMLVTFTEAYLQDALSLLLSEGLHACALPTDVGDEIKRKWI